MSEARPQDRPIDPTVKQRQASDPETSVWVGASAGTGKTKVLTDRVVRLMLAGTEPGRILCLTFTKAAAAEMANRIAERLASWVVMADGDLTQALADLNGRPPTRDEVLTARRLFARVLDTAGGMKIQTIHAFCQSLLRRFPLEARLPPNFQVMDDRTAAEALAEAQAHMLASAQDRPDTPLGRALKRLAGALNEESFAELLADLVAQRGRIRRILDAHGGLDGTVAALFRHLGVGPEETEAGVLAAGCRDEVLDVTGLRGACAALAEGTATDVERGLGIQRWLDQIDRRLTDIAAYRQLFLTADGTVRSRLATKGALAANPRTADILAQEGQRLVALQERLRAVTVAHSTASLLTLAGSMLEGYQRWKDSRAQLDFDDLILAASALLTGDAQACAWVLYKLDGGLDHILIDEAQDTNPEQWRVVSALAEEFFAGEGQSQARRTLFVVGDEKQSIFSFQGADPAEFARMRRTFQARVQQAERPWAIVDLETSFRSVGAVLQAVDTVFAQQEARDGVSAQAIRHRPFRQGMAGTVELWPLVRPGDGADTPAWSPPLHHEPEDRPQARLATVIADQIAHWIARGEVLEARGRPLTAGDILVLVRRRNAFVQQLVRALKERRVPVAGVDRMVLTEQLAVMDLMAVGQFLLMPEDDLTLATVLKSPFIGLDEEALFTLAHGRGGRLWPALVKRAETDMRFQPAYAWLRRLLGEVDYTAPYELFAGLLTRPCPADPVSGRRALLGRLGAEAIDPVDEFLSLCLGFDRAHPPSLQTFLHWLAAGKTEVKRELDTGAKDRGPEGGQVRIMTVHGSKGLQAPVVILPDTTRKPVTSPRILWPHGDEEGGDDDGGSAPGVPLYAPRREQEDVKARAARAAADRRRDQEYRRLLYVALTRAEDRLHVCGYEGKTATSDDTWFRLTERALAAVAPSRAFDLTAVSRQGWVGDGRVLSEPQTRPPPTQRAGRDGAEAVPPAPAWLLAPPAAEPAPSRPLAPSRPDGEEPAVRSPLGDGEAKEARRFKRGTLIHKLLQLLPEMPVAARAGAARRWLDRPAHGLDEAAREEIWSETLRVLNHDQFADLFGPDSRSEVPLVGTVGTRPLAAQIDRLVVTATEVKIVDFKTNRPPPRTAEEIPGLYVSQMAAYRDALRRIYPDLAIRCLLLWTDGPFITEVDPARMDAVILG
ncbi:double-strand break repair helicase AddA [Nitrospirillum viridazoti]|uniref:DNA 3'-5' helicase n=1 Tax=Nitrospirillum viridazoti CBAmc TaxID=1441467 RepID=A0A248JTY9_9PROT|nr:double-strand break repair helicase AddA [Nitrospirillum amazonense]ASG21684.1 double-strand break repair helicase AddA [Nitrospirillum amazonense CBAmc]TWB42155.1 DNA helicase/exodeoxyribonuclease V subunit A [Nitrospirillum amazonense]